MDQAIDLAVGNVMTQQGANATYYHNDETNIDFSTVKTTSNPTTETIKAVFTAFPKEQIDGQVIQRQDLQVLISASEFDTPPSIDDEIEDVNGNLYKVIAVDPTLIEHNPISYSLQVRQ